MIYVSDGRGRFGRKAESSRATEDSEGRSLTAEAALVTLKRQVWQDDVVHQCKACSSALKSQPAQSVLDRRTKGITDTKVCRRPTLRRLEQRDGRGQGNGCPRCQPLSSHPRRHEDWILNKGTVAVVGPTAFILSGDQWCWLVL